MVERFPSDNDETENDDLSFEGVPPDLAAWLEEWEDLRPGGGGGSLARETKEVPSLGSTSTRRVPSPPPVRSPAERPSERSEAAVSPEPAKPQPVGGASQFRDPIGDQDELDSEIIRVARQTTSRTVRIGGVDVTINSTQRAMALAAAVGSLLVVVFFAYLLSGLGREASSDFRQPASDVLTVADEPDLSVSADDPSPPTIAELAQATVQIVGLDDDGESVCAGSGVLVGSQGIILTNAHVVAADESCQFTRIGVAVTKNITEPPSLMYLADTLVSDPLLDLAVLRISGPLSSDEGPDIPPNFPGASLGDSDEVQLGDNVRILGYPVIGGDTITSTTGSVSGFSTQLEIGSRALIKTDAAISAGNSGGMALNDDGEVIGIPTRARASDTGPAVDCRQLSDTNGDGQIDDQDNCVPVGGFLNGIRPINLARDLLARAEAIMQAGSQLDPDRGSLDLSDVAIGNPRFSSGVENDNPVDDVATVLEGAEEICLFVDWSGIPNGVAWAAVWSLDGEQIDDFGIYDGTWEFGESGRNFWYCADDKRGHRAGTYEIGLFIDHQLAFVEAIEVTTEEVEKHEVTWVNQTEEDICGLAINPLALRRHAGINELPVGDVIKSGQSRTIELPAGVIVVEAYNCNGEAIAAELDGLVIPRDLFVNGEQVPFVIGDVPAPG